jgi:organic radical activating enzyme
MTVYPVVEIFHSIQGEGLNQGKSAWFVRMAHCNFNCKVRVGEKEFPCDEPLHSDDSKITKMSAKEIVNRLTDPADIIVITGGEPTLYDLTELCNEINLRCIPIEYQSNGVEFRMNWPVVKNHPHCGEMFDECETVISGPLICIETNGTLPIRGDIDFVCVSPKPLKFAKNANASYCKETLAEADEVKLVVGWSTEEDIDYFIDHCPDATLLFSPLTTFPEGKLIPEETEKAINLVKKYVGSRLSLQIHKWIGVR